MVYYNNVGKQTEINETKNMEHKLNNIQDLIDNSGLTLINLIALKNYLDKEVEIVQGEVLLFALEGKNPEIIRSQFNLIKRAIEAEGLEIVPRVIKGDGSIRWRITSRSWCSAYPPFKLVLTPDAEWGLEFLPKSEKCSDDYFDLALALRRSGIILACMDTGYESQNITIIPRVILSKGQ